MKGPKMSEYKPSSLRTAPSQKILSFLRKLRFGIYRRNRFFELPEIECLNTLFREYSVDCVFDVGANAGQYGTMLRRRVGYRGLILSFEPVPHLAEKVRRCAADDQNWTVFELALDEAHGEAMFNVMHADQFSSFGTPTTQSTGMFSYQNSVQSTIKVRKETLNRMFPALEKTHGFSSAFLKMDTQGFDVSVVKGGDDVIGSFVAIQSELAIKKLYAESVGYREAIDFYASKGFELSALVPNNAGHFPLLIEMDCIMVNKRMLGS